MRDIHLKGVGLSSDERRAIQGTSTWWGGGGGCMSISYITVITWASYITCREWGMELFDASGWCSLLGSMVR